MMAAIAIGKSLNQESKIVLIEKTDSLGKKLLLTGGGRCNIANASPIKNQLDKLKDKNFLKHSFYTLNNEQLLAIFKEKGLEFKEENGKYFPITENSKSILNILKDYLKELKVDVLLNNPVKSITKPITKSTTKNKKDLFEIKTSKSNMTSIYSEKVILTTGGITYPQTGSCGDGYKIATDFGHTISTLRPGLVPLKVKNNKFNQLSGITLENIEVSYRSIKTKGNVLITHFGLSGPAILDLSNFVVKDMIPGNTDNDFSDLAISLDLIPKLSEDELKNKIANDSQEYGKTKIKNYMKFYLKNRTIESFLSLANVDGDKTLSNMTKKDKNNIIAILKHLNIEINGMMPEKISMITCGGVSIDEINSKTMESKLTNGLYFAGELIEPYGPTGGYNLQIAFSTGYLAGESCAEK